MYACDGNNSEYCVPSCPGLSTATLARLTLFVSCECAEACGLAPCTTCRPDFRPLVA